MVNPLSNKAKQTIAALQPLSTAAKSGIRFNSTLLKASPGLFRCLRERRKPTAVEVRTLFESLGVTYIKLGQFIASSPTLFPADYVEAFQGCLDNTPAIPYREIIRIIEQELGHPSEHQFRYIEKTPLASASIAQVHGAVLHSGEKVVIKVQKPNVESIIDTDLNTAFFISRIIELVSPALDREAITDIISEIHRSMRDECDFIKEANNLTEFNDFLREQAINQVIAPKVYPAASGKKILTMSRINGKSFTDKSILDIDADTDNLLQFDAQAALFSALNAWFLSLKHCEFFHADLHSGNLLLTPSGQVAFIDFGMVGKITPAIWSAAVNLVQSFSEENFTAMAEAMIAVGMTKRKVDAAQLENDLRMMFTETMFSQDKPAGLEQSRGQHQEDKSNPSNDDNGPLTIVSSIARRHGIRFPSAFTLLLKQFLYFDRYLQLLAPDTDLFNHQNFQDSDTL